MLFELIYIPLTVAGIVGLAVMGFLFSMALRHKRMFGPDRYNDQEEGTADLLPFSAVGQDGIVVLKNGGLLAGWRYTGVDAASSTNVDKELNSYLLNLACTSLGSGWTIYTDAIRKAAPGYPEPDRSFFPDPITANIDEERREKFKTMGTLYEGEFYLVVVYKPPHVVEQKLASMMVEEDDESLRRESKNRTAEAELYEHFKMKLNDLEMRLGNVLKMRRLSKRRIQVENPVPHGRTGSDELYIDELLQWLNYCVTGDDHPIFSYDAPIYLDSVIGCKDYVSGIVPKIGNKFIQVVSIKGMPAQCYPGMLSALGELPVNYRWSARFICMDYSQAEAAITKYRSFWTGKKRGFVDQYKQDFSKVDQHAVEMEAETDEATADLNSGATVFGYYTSVVVLMSENRRELERSAGEIAKSVTLLGFVPQIESWNADEAFWGSIPGNLHQNVRRPITSANTLTDIMPISTVWTGRETVNCDFYPPDSPPVMQCMTSGNSPFRLTLHIHGVGHTLVFGPTGAGKSTFLCLLMAQLRRYPGMTIAAFDKGMSAYCLTKAVGGRHFTIAGEDSKLAFCPLEHLEDDSDIAWATSWIRTIIELNNHEVTPKENNAIYDAIIGLKKLREKGVTAKTMTHFVTQLQSSELKEILKPYVLGGHMGNLLDADNDGLAMSDFTTFEVDELMNLRNEFALPILLYLFRRIERRLKGQPAVIILDEAWVMLGHPVFQDKIKEWLKEMRKKNCSVVMATQSIADAAQSKIFDHIRDSTPTKIFLPNRYAKADDSARAVYKLFGLNDKSIDIIASMIPKGEYYYYSEEGRRTFNTAIGPYTLAFTGVSDKDSIATIRKLEDSFGDEWIDHWLRLRGVNPEERKHENGIRAGDQGEGME